MEHSTTPKKATKSRLNMFVEGGKRIEPMLLKKNQCELYRSPPPPESRREKHEALPSSQRSISGMISKFFTVSLALRSKSNLSLDITPTHNWSPAQTHLRHPRIQIQAASGHGYSCATQNDHATKNPQCQSRSVRSSTGCCAAASGMSPS